MDDSLLNLTTGNVGRELNNPQPTFHLQKERERDGEPLCFRTEIHTFCLHRHFEDERGGSLISLPAILSSRRIRKL